MTKRNENKTEQEPSRDDPDFPGLDDEEDHSLFGALEPTSSHFLARLRGYFLTGLIIVGPVAITIYVVWWFINLVDGFVRPLIPDAYLPDSFLPFNIPGVGLVFGIISLMLIGAWPPICSAGRS